MRLRALCPRGRGECRALRVGWVVDGSGAALPPEERGSANRQVMRNGQHQNKQRMRGRNNNNNNNNQHRKSHNPMSRVYESNGPDVKIRGTPSHIAEKYVQLARDAHTSGDPVAAENYYQHAEHYFRLIAAAQEQFRQNNPGFPRPESEIRNDSRDETFDDGDEAATQSMGETADVPYGTREPQPFIPRDVQPFPREQPQPVVRPQPQPAPNAAADVDRLPSFITGGHQPQAQPQANSQPYSGNGHDNGQGDRFPLHRRRRRHRGPRQDLPGSPQGGDRDDPSSRE
jgi:hypothetical protein